LLAWLDNIFSIVELIIPTTLDFYAGISSRQRVYQLLEDALADTRGKLREAEREVAFRRRVKELVG
jgi:hypothetical protein